MNSISGTTSRSAHAIVDALLAGLPIPPPLKTAKQTGTGVAAALTAQTPSKSTSSTAVLPEPTVPPTAPAQHAATSMLAGLSLGTVAFGDNVNTKAARQVEAQTASTPPPTGDASGLLASMAQAQKATEQTHVPQIDLLCFYNGLELDPDAEAEVRQCALDNIKAEAASAEFANAPLVDQNKVQVDLTDASWGLFRVFASDFGRNAETEKAHCLATGKEYGRNGLCDVAAKFYGTLCGHNPDGHAVRVCLGGYWWRTRRSEDIRIITEIKVEPTQDPDDPSSGLFNRFHIERRKAVRPDMTATREDIQVFDDHLLMTAGGCEVTREYVLDWLAFLYQNPGRKPATALAFCSPIQGTGKSWFQYPIKWVFGEDLVGITGGDTLYENFDDPFIDKWLGYVDELPDPKKKRSGTDPAAKLNRFITSDKTTMRPLGVKASPHRTPAVVISCNDVKYLVAVLEGRRLCIVYNPDQIRDAAYYKRLFDWSGEEKPGPGIAKLAGYLATRDVSKFNPKAHAPVTAGKILAKEAALSKEAQFLMTLYEEDHPLFTRDFGRALHVSAQLENLCTPGMLRGLNLSPTHLPKWFKELGWKQIGVDGSYQTADKASRAWCWRNWEKWGDASTSRKERIDHTAGAAPLTMYNGGLSQ
ncbi:primase-helicase family protein [Pseudomonas asiatica]|uniref:primase-helicase family protein n=1 Tax=Pseudomonas asiatica TaxID=2219225 RepID=UPI0018D88366|nr:primase-helicase family protein [Pseudomonas asiatica]MBH3378358.1 hypothetical protein [Pseudomonas asiatica]